MKNLHTPGPWNINDNGGNAVLIEAEDYEIGIVHNAGAECLSEDVRQESMANARLIAAAPELLEELQRVSEQARTFLQSDSFGLIKKKDFNKQAKNRLGAIIETAEAAIKKATSHEAN